MNKWKSVWVNECYDRRKLQGAEESWKEGWREEVLGGFGEEEAWRMAGRQEIREDEVPVGWNIVGKGRSMSKDAEWDVKE